MRWLKLLFAAIGMYAVWGISAGKPVEYNGIYVQDSIGNFYRIPPEVYWSGACLEDCCNFFHYCAYGTYMPASSFFPSYMSAIELDRYVRKGELMPLGDYRKKWRR